MRDDSMYLERIIEYCGQIKRDLERYGDDIESYIEDDSYQRSTDMSLQQIGETVNKLSPELRKKYNEVRWNAMIGFRNVVAHRYEQISRDRTWEIIHEDVPVLKEYCKDILYDLQKEKK